MSTNDDDRYPPPVVEPSMIGEAAAVGPARASREERYRRAADLLSSWREQKDGYDDEVWPLLREELDHGRFECRASA